MIKLSREAFSRYQARLNALNVSTRENPHYVKWVRYFLDFSEKYGAGVPEPELLEAFLSKLATKGQSASLRRQAGRAVRIYMEMVRVDGGGAAKESAVEREPVASEASSDWLDLERALAGEIKRRNYSPKTLSSYTKWLQRFRNFTGYMPVDEVTDETAKEFLTDLAVNQHVVASTQNQAFNALLFVFRHILKREYELGDKVVRAKTSKYIPTVLTRDEVSAVLAELDYPFDLIVSMLYGCGLRLGECLNLRVSDLDFDENLVVVHDGKGKKDRSVPLPQKLKAQLERQVARVGKLLDRDSRSKDFGGVFMPESLSRRRAIKEAKDFQWQWLFPSKLLTLVPDEGTLSALPLLSATCEPCPSQGSEESQNSQAGDSTYLSA